MQALSMYWNPVWSKGGAAAQDGEWPRWGNVLP